AKINKALTKLDYIYKVKQIVFKKGYKETLVIIQKDKVLEDLLAKSSLVLEV
ncbi:hypothetical protein GQ607_015905, partial [Colletotrichum asianum]